MVINKKKINKMTAETLFDVSKFKPVLYYFGLRYKNSSSSVFVSLTDFIFPHR